MASLPAPPTINLQSLSPITTSATALSNLVLVSPQSVVGYQPQSPSTKDGSLNIAAGSLPKLLFHYEGEQTVSLESDITDHYIEDNTAIQDQISIKPETITTHGFIGELNDVPPVGLAQLKSIADRLTTVGAYAPALSTTALLAYSEAFLLYQVAANAKTAAVSAWASAANIASGSKGQSVIGSNGLSSANCQNAQQTAFQQFYGYWRLRTLFTVQTPWAVFQNMAIKSLRAVQDSDTNQITDFEVTFKMIRTAATITASSLDAVLSGRLTGQSQDEVDLGTNAPADAPSFASGALTFLGF